jgi:hypothetical protein
MGRSKDVTIEWEPQPKQAELLKACGLLDVVENGGLPTPAVADLIGYGGAAFGGKSDGLIAIALIACLAYSGLNVGYFRREFPDLEGSGGAISRSLEIFGDVATYNKTQHVWTFVNGSALHFCHCKSEKDAYGYKSQSWDILLIDEATSFTWFIVDYLLTRNRATGETGCKPFAAMATNPGDIGHSWYMNSFDILKGQGEHCQIKMVKNPNDKAESIFFIPAFIEDNQIGVARDPGYEDRLMKRDPIIGRALRVGDWTVFEGQAFPQWRYDRHTEDYPEEGYPLEWPHWRSLDYGFNHPMACYWWTKNPLNTRNFVYREIVQSGLTDPMMAEMIKEATLPGERILHTYASPDMWKAAHQGNQTTTSIDEFTRRGIILTPADNDRINGKHKLDGLLADLADGQPGMIVTRNCTELIRVVPTLIRDRLRPEDVKKMDGDDPYDGWRYGATKTGVAVVQQSLHIERTQSPLMEVSRGIL